MCGLAGGIVSAAAGQMIVGDNAPKPVDKVEPMKPAEPMEPMEPMGVDTPTTMDTPTTPKGPSNTGLQIGGY